MSLEGLVLSADPLKLPSHRRIVSGASISFAQLLTDH